MKRTDCRPRCRRVLWLCMGLSAVCSSALIFAVVLFREFFAGLFTADAAVIESACVRILCIQKQNIFILPVDVLSEDIIIALLLEQLYDSLFQLVFCELASFKYIIHGLRLLSLICLLKSALYQNRANVFYLRIEFLYPTNSHININVFLLYIYVRKIKFDFTKSF